MKIKKFNFKKLAAIGTALALQTSGMVANLNVGFAEEDAPQVIEEVVENKIEDNMTITIDKITVEDENTRTTTTTQEASGTYSTREEAEQAVEEAIDHLVDEGYTPTETSITEEIAGSHTEEGEKITETEGNFETEGEAESAMEERISELEDEGYRIDEATVVETGEHQVGTDHNESTETSDITYESEEEARAAAEDRISEIESGLNDDQTLDSSVTITSETRKTGEECVDIAREGKTFWYDKETGKYVNSEGMTFEEYIETTRGSFEESGIVNINISTHYGEDTRTEVDSTVTSEHYEFEDEDAAQTELDRIMSTYTEENGYANLKIHASSHMRPMPREETDTFTYTYGTEEEAQEAIRGVVDDLLHQGYEVSDEDITITQRTETSIEAAGQEYTETSSTPFETEEEARDAMESAMADLEGDYGNIEGTIFEQELVDHYEAGEEQTYASIDGSFSTIEEARAAAKEYISSISLEEGHILIDYSFTVTSAMVKIGEEVKQTDTVSTMHFTLNENGVYVNEDGIDLDTYVAAAKFAAGQDGYVNIEVNKEYTDGSHTEAGEAIHETGTFDTREAAINALAELALKYTKENGYTNIQIGEIITRQVEDGTRTDTDSRESTGISESNRETETQRLIKELTDGGYTVTDQDIEATSFEVTLRDDQGNVVFEENPEKETVSENPIYEDQNEYETRAGAEARITELQTEYQGETRTEGNDEDGYVRYDTSYTFEIKTGSSLKTEEINNETYETEAEALEIIAALEKQGYEVNYVIEPETQTIQVTVNKSFATEAEANNYAEEVRESLDTIYEDIKVSKQRTGKTETHKLDLDEEGVTGLTYGQAVERLAELEKVFTDTDETTYEIKIVRAVDDDGEPINMTKVDDIKTVEETFTTLDAAKAYIEWLKSQGYNDVSDLQIQIDYTTSETWEDQEHSEVDIDPDHEGKIYHYDHLDIIYGGGNGKTTMTYVDLTAEDPSKQTYTIQGALHVDHVIIDNAGVKQNLSMRASIDAGRGDNEYKSPRGFGYDGYTKEDIVINGKERTFNIYNDSPINDNTIVTIDGTLEYTNPVTGVVTTIPYKLTGKLNGGTNKCQNTSAWGYDLTFSSITIINESVLIDANIDYEYKVIGEAIATHIAEAYDVEVTQTDHEVKYVVTGKGEREENTGRVILNASASKDITVYTVDVHKVSREFISKKETRYDIKVTGSKLVQLYKDVYDINLDCNVLDTIIDENQYLDVELTGDIMEDILAQYFGYVVRYKDIAPVMAKYYGYNITANEMVEILNIYYDLVVKGHYIVVNFKQVYDIDVDYNVIKTIIDKYVDVEVTGEVMADIMTEYFGYIIKLDVMTPIMEKYYGYEISATEMKEILDYYYRVVVKGEKVEVVPIEKEDERDPMDIPKTGQNNRLNADLALMASALLAGSALVLKKKKEEEDEKGKTLSK